MRPIYVTRSLSVLADADGIALDQNLAAAGNLVLTGAALVVAGVAQLGAQRKVLLTSGAGDNLAAITFTIYGTDDQGHSISESLAGPNAGTVQSVLDYSTVTRIAASAAFGVGITVSAGTNDVGASAPIPMDQYLPNFLAMIAALIRSGAVNYTVQYTFDNVFDAYDFSNTNIFLPGASSGRPDLIAWWDHSTMTALAVSGKGELNAPVKAIRVVTNSGAGELELQVVQQGTM